MFFRCPTYESFAGPCAWGYKFGKLSSSAMPEAERVSLEEAWPAPTEAHVRDATERLIRAFRPVRIVVFGSYARGEAKPGSDMDLLVVLPEVEEKREAAVAMRRVLADLPVPHDVYVTTPEEIERRGWIIGTLLHAALREGKTVYAVESRYPADLPDITASEAKEATADAARIFGAVPNEVEARLADEPSDE